MKKLLSIMAAVLFISFNLANAQTSEKSSTSTSVTTSKSEVKESPSRDCHSGTPSCSHASSSKTSSDNTTLSGNHANEGSAATAKSSSVSEKNVHCEGNGKSCCKPGGKASFFSKSTKDAKASVAPAQEKSADPKQ